jgi:DNA ligase-1
VYVFFPTLVINFPVQTYYCTCTAWKQQSAPTSHRTCKHLRGYLGEEFEKERLSSMEAEEVVSKAKAQKNIPQLLLAQKWELTQNPKGWWVSEKLDGVRAYWDGTYVFGGVGINFLRSFISRLGNEFLAPNFYTEGLPDFPLDGELWVGRKMFSKTISIVKSKDAGEHWKKVVYKGIPMGVTCNNKSFRCSCG